MAKSVNLELNLTPEIEIAQTLFDEWRQSIDGFQGENPSNFEIIDTAIGEINEKLNNLTILKFERVEQLPPKQEAKTDIIYLVPSSESGEDNIYNEYIFLETENEYELIGSTQITFDQTPTEGSQNAVTSGGVYTALQNKQNTIQDLNTIRSGSQKGETAVQPNDLATVATTGSYNDLLDKPTIPLEQVQADWNQTDDTAVDYIKNKPEIPANQVHYLSDILEDNIFVKKEYEDLLFNFQINIIGDVFDSSLFNDSYLLFKPLNDVDFDGSNWSPIYGTIYYDKTTDSAEKLAILKFKFRNYTDPETGETTQRLSFDKTEDLLIEDLSGGGGGSGMDITAQEIADYFDEYCDIEAEVTEETIEGEEVNVLNLENVDLETGIEYSTLELNASNVSATNKILDIE